MSSLLELLNEHDRDLYGMRKFFEDNLGEYLEDIASYGADCGFPYITYTNDTVEIFDTFREPMIDFLFDEADQFGYTVPAMIDTWNRSDMGERFTLYLLSEERMMGPMDKRDLQGWINDLSGTEVFGDDIRSWKNLVVWAVAEDVARRSVEI